MEYHQLQYQFDWRIYNAGFSSFLIYKNELKSWKSFNSFWFIFFFYTSLLLKEKTTSCEPTLLYTHLFDFVILKSWCTVKKNILKACMKRSVILYFQRKKWKSTFELPFPSWIRLKNVLVIFTIYCSQMHCINIFGL